MRARALVALLALVAGPARAADAPLHLVFQPHSTFFSFETRQPQLIDPQVFVQDSLAGPGTGPQGIRHVSGVRPAAPGSDAPDARLYNADDKPLGFTLGEWLGAKGSATVTPSGTGAIVAMTFTGLRPNARYSLFENHFDTSPVGFTPLDGSGTSNSFTADVKGDASITVTAPKMPTHDNALLLILDDDGKTYGMQRGPIGVAVQHQLIARPEG